MTASGVPDRVHRVGLEEQWQHQGGGGHDHHEQRDPEQGPASDELSVSQSVSRGDRTDQSDHNPTEGIDGGVLEPVQQRVVLEGEHDVGRVRQILKGSQGEGILEHQLMVGLEGRQQKPDHRHHEKCRKAQQHDVGDGARPDPIEVSHPHSTSNSFVRKTSTAAQSSPITRRSTEIAAA